ncbi:MAG: hypothetical protein WC952_14375, partial [Desulfobulbaceae bacterium]
PVRSWDRQTMQILAIYDLACPWGDLERDWLEDALADLDIPVHQRPRYRRLVLAVHRQVKEHHADALKQQQGRD